MESTFIQGPAGRIEAVVDDTASDVWAVLCHPHPLYGGSLFDGVLAIAQAEFKSVGGASIRFNFRGVGSSDGEYDEGKGEVDDALAVLDWLNEAKAPAKTVLAGYSFGSMVALRAAALRDLDQLVLIAPPTSMLGPVELPDVATSIIAGSDDPYVEAAALERLSDSATLTVIPGGDHFFGSVANELASALSSAFRAVGS